MLHTTHGRRHLPLDLRLLLALLGLVGALCASEIVMNHVSHRPLNVRPENLGGVTKRGSGGSTYFMSVVRGVVHRFGDNGEPIVSFQLEPPPESASAKVDFMEDMAIDSAGRIFVPAIFSRKPRGGSAVVIVYDAGGHYQRTIVLAPRANIRHLALDASGNIFVLGIDPGYFLGATNSCLLVHKYTPDGERVTAFSGCPIAPGERPIAGGPQFEQLNFEVDRGSIWVKNGRLYQVLPASRVVRVFDTVTGVGLSETSLQLPGPGEVSPSDVDSAVAWRVLPMGQHGYLVLWSGQWKAQSSMAPKRFLSAHDEKGTALTPASYAPFSRGIPVAADVEGQIFILGPERDGTAGLSRSVVRIQ